MFKFLHNIIPPNILLEIGPLTIRYYGLFLMLAILAAIFITIRISKWYKIKKDIILDLSIYLIIGGILGARIYDVFLELPYYLNNPQQIIQVWKGGLAIHGGLMGGFLALLFFIQKYKLSLIKITAIIIPGVALGQSIGRWGNWFNQELFGLPSKLAFAIPIDLINRPIAYINETHFHPTFLYESVACFFLACLLFYLHWRWHKKITHKQEKIIISLYLSIYAFIRFMLEFIKVDYTPIFLNLRWPQFTSLLMLVLSIVILFYTDKSKINNN